jgi:hypothetical protein
MWLLENLCVRLVAAIRRFVPENARSKAESGVAKGGEAHATNRSLAALGMTERRSTAV